LDLQAPLYVVSQTQTSNGIGGTYTTNYTYAGAKLHELGGGFLGFRQVTANDPQTGITTTTTYSQNYPYQGLPLTVAKQTANGAWLNYAQNTWQNTSLGGGSYHRSDLVQTNEQSWDLNGAALPRSQTNTRYDGYGNATQIIVKTDDGYSSSGPVSPFGNVKTTTNTYSNDTTNWFLGRLTRATVTSSLPNGLSATRTSAFAYDLSSGLLTQEIIEPDTLSLKLATTYLLDGFGNRIASTVSGADIATRSSSTQYDAQGRFAVSSTNALGHKETRTFEPGFGNPLTLTGPNGLTTYWAYDGFGRKLQENRADGTQSNFTFTFCASNCPANGVYYTTSTSSGAPASTVYYDSLNRELRKTTVGFDGRIAIVDKLYNNLGQVASTSRPYFPGEAVSWTQFQYDVLGRTVKITEPDGGVTQSSYNGLTVSVTNALNHTTQQIKNGLGQVVQTTDAKGNGLAFSFDPFGNPLKTIDPKGNAVTLSYDLRGRKIAMTDPDMGAWSYGYDVLGEMLWQKDAKGQITYVSYDLLGRVVKRQEPGLNSVWTWDTAPKGIGKLAAETSNNGFSRSYAYDNYGRLAQTTTSINGAGTYYQSTVYDGYGRVASFTQPTGLSVVNVYNSYGYLSQVLDGTAQTPYWQAQQVDASGRIILECLGNNLYTQRSFDGMGRPTYIATGKFGVIPDIQNLHLNHDQNGNLISRDDYATQRGDSFVYDELDRLTVDLGPNGKILNYQYDELGNINYKTDVGSYFYGAKPHAVTQISGNINAALLYDANGNQSLGLNNRSVMYTAFNLPSKIVQGTTRWLSIMTPTMNVSAKPARTARRFT
jgi:YD repeat-containing protein